MWTIEDSNMLVLTLEKYQENIWKTVIKGDIEIDTSQVENVKNLNDFDEETQGALKKAIYEQDLINRGLKTPEE